MKHANFQTFEKMYKNLKQQIKLILTFCLLSVTHNAFSQLSVSISPSADARIFNGATTTNYGSCDEMWVGYGGTATSISRGLIHFDLTDLPVGAVVISAYLELDVVNSTGVDVPISVHRVTNLWIEGSSSCAGTAALPVSWTRRNTASNWSVAGGDYTASGIDTTTVGDEGTYSWDVTTMVNSWLTNVANYGLLLRFTSEMGNNIKYFATKEHADESLQPRLVINYSLPSISPIWHFSDQKESSGTGALLSVEKPSNTAEGDLIILIFTQQNSPLSASTELSGFSTPTGFNLIKSARNGGNISRPEVVAFYKIATNNEPDFYTSNVSAYPVTPNWKAIAARVTGHDPTIPIHTTSTQVASNSVATSAVVPAITPSQFNTLLVAARTVRVLATNETTPTGMVFAWSQSGTGTTDNNANAPSFKGAVQAWPNNTTTGTKTFNWTGTAYSAGLMFLINPVNGLPGGVASPRLWIKADLGVTPTTEGSVVTGWRNFNNLTNLSQSTSASYRPIYRTTTNLINFNPTVEFDGVDDYLNTSSNHGVSGTSSFTDFAVARRLSQNTEDDIWGQASTNNNSAAHSMTINALTQNINSRPNTTNRKDGIGIIPLNTPFLSGVNRSSNNSFQLFYNGAFDGPAGSISNFGGSFLTSNLRIGSRSASNYSFHGQIGEVIIYNSSLSDAAMNRINSYLALKYGISMNDGIGSQYIASDGSTIFWNHTLNAGFNYGIFGIGKDNGSTLHQRISRSSHTNDIVTISTDYDLSNPNFYHGIIFNDISFLLMGNNNASVFVESSEINYNLYNSRISREWKVQNTDFTDTVCLKFDGFGSTALSTVYLIKKNNNSDFSSGTTEVGALNANGEITGVTLNNNDYFTLAFRDCAPGGVYQNLSFWVKGDMGTILNSNKVTQWIDLSGNNRDIFQNTDSNRPTLNTNGQNFNPTINFTASNTQFFERNPNFDIFAGSYSIYIVGYNTSGQRTFLTVNESGGASYNSGIHIEYNDQSDPPLMRFLHRNPPSQGGGDNLVQSVNISNTRSNVMSFYRNTTTKHKFSINGETEVSLTPAVAAFTAGVFTDMTVGQLGSENQRYLNGDIAEILIYNTDNETDKAKIESYLAIKYGISLNDGTGTNYIASDGSTIFWNSASNSGFNYDIFGIGRDDRSCLHQKQSKTTNDGPFFSVYFLNNESEALPATNLLNTANIPNNYDFLMFGNNNGNISEWYRFDEMPPFLISRIERIWKVQKTGSITASVIAVNTADLPTNTLNLPVYLIVSSSPTLEDAEYYPMDLLGTTWRISYNFTTNTYISFGYGVNLAPMRHGKGVVEGERVPFK